MFTFNVLTKNICRFMMERSKRLFSDVTPKILEPFLTRIDQKDRIRIYKNEFKIGCARDNDEIISDVTISRRHCILRCEGHDEWTIKDLSSSATFVNGVAILPGVMQKLSPGDIIQFSPNETFRYVFTLVEKEHCVKRPRIDKKILDTVLTKQKTFAENQEYQRKELKDKLQIEQKEQVELKQQLEDLLLQHTAGKDDKENLIKQIAVLENKIEVVKKLLERLEKLQFEVRINEEKQKWQEALNMSKQEKEILEIKMKEQMEKWRKEQEKWKDTENKVKEEKNIQAQLLNEKNMLEEKLKETEKRLKEQETKAEMCQAILDANLPVEPVANSADNCIFAEVVDSDQSSAVRILDTIDLTGSSPNIIEANAKESVLEKVSDIMGEQLTCSICSELFVKATTLNCAHTFCHHCIHIWDKKRSGCPICRKSVMSMHRLLVLDKFIESMIKNLPTDLKNRRKEIIKERQALKKMKRY